MVGSWGFQPRKRKAMGGRAVSVLEKGWQRRTRTVASGLQWKEGAEVLGSLAGLKFSERKHFLDHRIAQK